MSFGRKNTEEMEVREGVVAGFRKLLYCGREEGEWENRRELLGATGGLLKTLA